MEWPSNKSTERSIDGKWCLIIAVHRNYITKEYCVCDNNIIMFEVGSMFDIHDQGECFRNLVDIDICIVV